MKFVGLILSLSSLLTMAEEIRLYSERHYDADKKIFAAFTDQTGIKVKVVKAGANELLARLESESAAPQADLYIASDAASLTRASDSGLLVPLESEVIAKQVPEALRSTKDHWAAFTMRGRVIVYAKDRVKTDLPQSFLDLAQPQYKGNILIRSSTSKYNRSLLASLITNEGKTKAMSWARGVKNNLARPPQGGDRDQIRGVAKGLADFAVTNTYYLGIMEKSSNADDQKARAAVEIILPDSSTHGTHVNVSGGGIVKGAENAANARRFLEYLVSDSVQKAYQELTSEYAVVAGIEPEPIQKAWGELKPDLKSLPKLATHDKAAVKIFNLVGWK